MTVHLAYLAEDGADNGTGIRTVEPSPDSPQFQRGSFYAVVDLAGPPEAGSALADRILSAMQRTYYAFKGTQSQVMLETVRSAQQVLEAENARMAAPWVAGVICIGLMNDRLALAGLGDAFAFVTTDGGNVNVYPPERLAPTFPAEAELPQLWPLHRQRIDRSGSIVAGSGRWLELVSARTLAGAAAFVSPDSCQDAAEGLRQQAGRADIPGVIVVYAADGAPPGSLRPGGANLPPGGSPPRLRTGGLPTALNAAPPVTRIPPQQPPVSRASAGAVAAAASATAISDCAAAASSPAAGIAPEAKMPPVEEHASAASMIGARPGATAVLAAGARAAFSRARALLTSMLPDRDAEGGAAAMAATTVAPDALYDMPVGGSAAAVRTPPYVPPPRATGSRARMLVATAVIVLLMVPAVVAAVYWQQGATHRAEAESLLELAEARLLSAQDALDQDDQATGRAMLTEARSYVLQSEEILGRTGASSELLAQVDRELQDVLQITLLYGLSEPLATFPVDAEPQGMLVIDQDVYVLDSGKGEVIKYRMEADGETLTEGEGETVLRTGSTINGVEVGQFLDLAWQLPIPGYIDKSSLLVLDVNNRVFRYNQVDGASLLSFGDPGNWTRVNQLETYLDRLYVSDDSANHIYRYAPGQYREAPQPWFQPTTQVNLLGTKVMRIDGDIWLLYNDGKVLRYNSGEQVPFSLDESVALPADAVDLYVSQQGDSTLYIADGAEERILLFDKDNGKYLGQFKAAEGRPLRNLRSIFIDETRSALFLLTDEALYQQRLPR